MNKTEVKKKLQQYFKDAGFDSGDSYRAINYNGSSKKEIWENFKIVTDEDSNEWVPIDYVVCTKCYVCFVYSTKDKSVKGFESHNCTKAKATSGQLLLSFNPPLTNVHDKRKITAEGCKLVASNLNRSFQSVDSDGICFHFYSKCLIANIAYIQSIVDMAVSYAIKN